jgi:methyltransferase OMS1
MEMATKQNRCQLQHGRIQMHEVKPRRAFLQTVAMMSSALLANSCIASIPPISQGAKYDSYADSYDTLDDGQVAASLGMDKQRQEIISLARGKVLEVGVGTGINLQYYNLDSVESLTAVDLSSGMLTKARQKPIGDSRESLGSASNTVSATFEVANVEELPFENSTFDTVVDTFSLCVYRKPEQALAEMSRVLKPGGTLLLLEHSKSKSNSVLGVYQDLTAGLVASFGGKGCVWNQNVDAMIAGVGRGNDLRVVQRTEYISGLITSYIISKE